MKIFLKEIDFVSRKKVCDVMNNPIR